MEEKEYMEDILLTNIQRFSLHDGPGIRTTIFLKGCPIRCPWCSNPENLSPVLQPYTKGQIEDVFGRYCSWESLYGEIMKDVNFYFGEIVPADFNIKKEEDLEKLPGGVTFSGGEPLLQIDKLIPLLKKFKDEGVHMVVETSLFVNERQMEMAVKYINLFYVDIKILDYNTALKIHHGDVIQYEKNFEILMESEKPVVLRVPVIGGYTDNEKNRKEVIKFILKYYSVKEKLFIEKQMYNNILKVELIKGHNLGVNKYSFLNYPIPEYKSVSDDFLQIYQRELEDETGIKADICKI